MREKTVWTVRVEGRGERTAAELVRDLLVRKCGQPGPADEEIHGKPPDLR